MKNQVICEYYLNGKKEFVLKAFLVVKFWFITIKKVPILNVPESLSHVKDDFTFQLIKENLYSPKDELCNSCKNGYDGTNGNGYQPCGCTNKRGL